MKAFLRSGLGYCLAAALSVGLAATSGQAAQPGTSLGGALGITMSPDDTEGAVIVTVPPKTPAAAAALKPGDRILAINGEPVSGYGSVIRMVRAQPPGAKVRIDLDRNGMRGSLWAVLGSQADVTRTVQAGMPPPPPPPPPAPPTGY
jgi:putative serine protease PepD